MQADPGIIREFDHIFRLYCHESQRVFHDRLVDNHDKKYFNAMLSEMAAKHFSKVCLHTTSVPLLMNNRHATEVIKSLGLSIHSLWFIMLITPLNIKPCT